MSPNSNNKNNSDLHFYSCEQCGLLLLKNISTSSLRFTCPSCQNEKFRRLGRNFLLHCDTCYEYWPKRVILIISKEGVCRCPDSKCNGYLRLRKEFSMDDARKRLSETVQSKMNTSFRQKQQTSASSTIPSISDISSDQESHLNSNFTPFPQPKRESESLSKKHDLGTFLPLNPCFIPEKSNLSLDPSKIDNIFQKLLNFHPDSLNFHLLQEVDMIYSQLLKSINHEEKIIITEDVKSITYIGNLEGDLLQIQKVIEYIHKIVAKYPSNKFVFLGNYFNHSPLDFIFLGLLVILKLKYPQNIRILRAKSDFPEIYDLTSHINQYFSEINQSWEVESEEKLIHLLVAIGEKFLGICGFLPFFHVARMNQGNIHIFGTHRAFPYDGIEQNSLDLQTFYDSVKLPLTQWATLPKSLKFALEAVPLTASDDISQSINGDSPQFTKELYFKFLQKNQFRYLVCTHDFSSTNFLFQDLICSINSNSRANTNKSGTKNQIGHIVRLTPGQSPMLLNIQQNLQYDLQNTYGIE